MERERQTDRQTRAETLPCLAGFIYCSLLKVDFLTPTGFIRCMYNTLCVMLRIKTQGLLHVRQVPQH